MHEPGGEGLGVGPLPPQAPQVNEHFRCTFFLLHFDRHFVVHLASVSLQGPWPGFGVGLGVGLDTGLGVGLGPEPFRLH